METLAALAIVCAVILFLVLGIETSKTDPLKHTKFGVAVTERVADYYSPGEEFYK
jgi:hypothetical protein